MQTVTTNNGVELHVKGSIIYTTDAKAFWRSGNMLVGNGTVISYQCRSMDEAVDMVAALYNGRKQKQRKHNHPAKIYVVHLFGWTAFCFVNTAIQWRSEPILPAV
jgi:hypothetical protein